MNASSFNQEANIEEPSFFVSLEGDFSSCDNIDEKEVTYGAIFDIDYDPITHSFFSKSPILDSEIYVPDPSHLVHTSLIDGVQPSDFEDVCLATSSLICVIPLTLLDIMCFSISSFVLVIDTQNLLEDFEHLILSSFHTEDSLPVYSHESIDMLICNPLDSNLEAYLQVYTYIISPSIPFRSIQVLHQIGILTRDSHHNFAAIQGIGCEINCLIFCTL